VPHISPKEGEIWGTRFSFPAGFKKIICLAGRCRPTCAGSTI
jgi:hypothetical protein